MTRDHRDKGSFAMGLRLPGLLYLAGMALVLIGERVIGGDDAKRWALVVAGLAFVVGGLFVAWRQSAEAAEGQQPAYRLPVSWGVLGLASLAIYALRSDMVLAALNFADDETEHRYTVVVDAIWPIVWLAGTLPFLLVDRVLAMNPVRVVPVRVREAGVGGLGLALAIAMLFPLNYVGADLNKRWDFGYFKTARPGTATQQMVAALEDPVTVYLFFPAAFDVTEELRTYFDLLPKGNLTVEYVDQALEPELAKELKVRDNGNIAVVRGEGEDQQVEKVKIGEDFDSAKRKLKKLDSEFQKALLKIARGKKVAYFTVGHGEMYWKSGEDADLKLGNFKKLLQAFNYSTKELGLTEGLGVEVPEDADIVFVLGPQSEFLPEELEALDAYRRRGGSLMIALEPGSPDMSALLDPIGVGWSPEGTLANDAKFAPRTRRIADRVNLITNKFSTHESVTTLSRNSQVLIAVLPGAGELSEKKDGQAQDNKTTVTIRSLSDTWLDLDGDLEFDADTEARKVYTLAMAAEGPAADAPPPEEDEAAGEGDEDKGDEDKGDEDKGTDYRVVVLADATWASDLALPLDPNKANYYLALDQIAWLGHELETQGTTESEEDVKIEHTREGQGWLFYGTAFIVPLGLLGGGLARIRRRRTRGAA